MKIEIVAGLTTLAASIGFLLARTFIGQKKQPGQQKPGNRHTPKNSELFNQLLLQTMGDRAKALRLIEAERRRNPNASESELTKAAIDEHKYKSWR